MTGYYRLIYLAIGKEMEPSLLLPMGFGTILVNIPFSDALVGPIHELYAAGIANELFPLLLFIGIGAMIDFGPLLTNPKLMLFGAAAQFGIFFTLCMASVFFPDFRDFFSIAIIGIIILATKLVNFLFSEQVDFMLKSPTPVGVGLLLLSLRENRSAGLHASVW